MRLTLFLSLPDRVLVTVFRQTVPRPSLQEATALTTGPTTAPFQSGGPRGAQLSWGRTPLVQGACGGRAP